MAPLETLPEDTTNVWFADGEWWYKRPPPEEMVNTNLEPHLRQVAARSLAEQFRAEQFWMETGVCTYDPRSMDGWPLGQMHCPVCNHPQVCGVPHLGYGREIDFDMMNEWDRAEAFRTGVWPEWVEDGSPVGRDDVSAR